ncbi:hypothetical protein BV20DRAFT_1054663 [Pilatotrama ljubarskyi]|nr:hypothetical protein BV20DRAFT_1054663 [Pilatotrama ljubarskyi]
MACPYLQALKETKRAMVSLLESYSEQLGRDLGVHTVNDLEIWRGSLLSTLKAGSTTLSLDILQKLHAEAVWAQHTDVSTLAIDLAGVISRTDRLQHIQDEKCHYYLGQTETRAALDLLVKNAGRISEHTLEAVYKKLLCLLEDRVAAFWILCTTLEDATSTWHPGEVLEEERRDVVQRMQRMYGQLVEQSERQSLLIDEAKLVREEVRARALIEGNGAEFTLDDLLAARSRYAKYQASIAEVTRDQLEADILFETQMSAIRLLVQSQV